MSSLHRADQTGDNDSLGRGSVENALSNIAQVIGSDLVCFKEGTTIKISPRYPYRTLAASNEFRLLRLGPASSNIDIDRKPRKGGYLQGTISEHKLGDNVAYDCLSYVWGDPAPSNILHLEGGLLTITHSLDAALRRMQDDKEDRLVWADQVCINQKDVEERKQQVQNMRHIYSHGQRVKAWLGDQADDSQRIPLYLQAGYR
jgi:hypothetical protein